jgi:aryl-alcohol dehydrogenase-like predicted oxidoreductase
MGKDEITRKQFIHKALIGLGGIILLPSFKPALRSLGATGIAVSPICFGATGSMEPSVIRYACEKGINFIDTGHSYSNGNNEILVGRAISGMRKNIIVLSKLRLEKDEISRENGKYSPSDIKKILGEKTRKCLNALNTDYIDVLLFHDAIDEELLFHRATMDFFNSLKQSGTIRAHGFSAHKSNIELTARNNTEGFYDVIMAPVNKRGYYRSQSGEIYYSWNLEKQMTILSEAARKGTGIIAIKPFSENNDEGQYSEFKWISEQEIISSTVLPIDSYELADRYVNLLILL